MIEKIEKLTHLPKQKLLKIVMFIGALALLGILLSESVLPKNTTQNNSRDSEQSMAQLEEKTEKRLEKILSEIDGIGCVKVMVSFESNTQNVYCSDEENQSQTDAQSRSESETKKYVIIDDGGERPVLEKEIQPVIRGVIVVCEGADNSLIKEAVTQAVCAGLGVSVSRISVVRGGNNG